MAAGSTYTPIATTTLSSAQNSVTFSSISGSYTDLVLVANYSTSTNNSVGIYAQFNSDTGSNYSATIMSGTTTTAASSRTTGATFIRIGGMVSGTSSSFSNITITNIFNYANTTTYKSILTRTGSADNVNVASVGLWRSTSAITSIVITGESLQDIGSGSTLTLYGITAA